MDRGFTERDREILKKSELFAGLSGERLAASLDFFEASPARYGKGEFLHRVGSRLTRFGLVLSGRVQVHMDDFEGNRIIMANVTPGMTFGESLCFLGTEEEPVTISAAEDVKVAWLRAEGVRRMPGNAGDHELVLRFIRLVTGRALAMNDRIQILSKRSLRDKLVVFFSQCAHQYGSSSFALPFNRNDMASYLGTNRSALSRELSRMQKEGILRYEKNHFWLSGLKG